MVFRLAENAKMAFSGALNGTLGRKRYAIRTYGDAVNCLVSKYATHATMANTYHDIITMEQQDNQAPTAFSHRVETQCDLLNGLFDIQDVKYFLITGLSDLVQAHVRALNDQLSDWTLFETVAIAQIYWDGTKKLRLQLKMNRQTSIKVAYATQDQRTTTKRRSHRFAPRRPRGPPSIKPIRLTSATVVRTSALPANWMAYAEELTTLPRIRDANNNRLVTKYAIHLNVNTGGELLSDRFLVSDILSVPCILGTQFIEQNIGTILPRLRKIVLQEHVLCTETLPRPTPILACHNGSA